MAVYCKYKGGREVKINFKDLDQISHIETKNTYNLILIEKGSINIKINNKTLICSAPSLIAIKENTKINITSSHMLLAKIISFDISFLNINLSYDLINSGKYDEVCECYSFIPLDIFYKKNDIFCGYLPLYSEYLLSIQKHFYDFNEAISSQKDKRWSCRARLHLNIILELAHQSFLDYIDEKTAFYDIKNPNIWVSILLKKIHNDYMNEISLITLSEYIHINKTTVSIYFKKITGLSVTDYIINYRIKCACYALATTEITLKEIASECGFKQEGYFIRQFKKKKGITPTEFRKECIKKRKENYKLENVLKSVYEHKTSV
ncbi:MAG: helix-turn-helix domain-containing protein [Ruminococcaceae bacterium]|nr:helix-turn-helix domain-containing protein [Oscillospiraceae bacterium]